MIMEVTSPADKRRYDTFALRSYVEDNRCRSARSTSDSMNIRAYILGALFVRRSICYLWRRLPGMVLWQR